MELKHIISRNIRRIRKAKGLSQKRLAELSKIDVRQLSRYENRPDDMNTWTIQRLASGLGVSASELLADSEEAVRDVQLPRTLAPGLREAIDVLKIHLRRVKK
jgi:transcriptional regulator with XRE-family HTH domain